MYIPTIFFGAQNDCIECDFSGSLIPDGITFDKVNSDWAYIKIPAGKEVQFQTQTGITSNAKVLIVGGGGYSNSATTSAGGGGAGQVIFQDFATEPGINYYASASFGGNASQNTGGSSVFIENYVVDPVEWTVNTAVGGNTNTTVTGGSSGDGFAGGAGCVSNTAAGGGGGSTGVGGNATCGGSEVGGDGGPGTTIPAPFDTVVGFSTIAGGGPGKSTATDGSWNGVSPSAYGNGGFDSDGNEGVVFIFLPITNCNSGSRESEFFKAEGGDVVGTFTSGSVQYKYHAFTNGSSSLDGRNVFDVTQGITYEAKTLVLGAGAGSATTFSNYADGPNEYCAQTGGGAGAGGLKFTDNVKLWGYSNRVDVGEGGPKYANGYGSSITIWPEFNQNQADGGGHGAYQNPSISPSSAPAQNGGSGGGGFFDVDNTGGTTTGNGIGNDGGDGYSGGPSANQKKAGGGGGGAGSAGSNAVATYDGAPISDRYAAGGSGYDLTGTFWGFLTGSVYTSRPDIAIGGSGSAGVYSSGTAPHTCGTQPAGGDNGSQANDGSGANPVNNSRGNKGIVVIAYPISGSIENSQI